MAVGLLTVPIASAASASTNGNWWYSAYHVADAQSAGWTGKGVKIAVIDGQVDPALPVFKGANLTVDPTPLCKGNPGASPTTSDPDGDYHGSNVTAQIVGNGTGANGVKGIAPGADVTFYAYGMNVVSDGSSCDVGSSSEDPYGIALQQAIAGGAKIVTTSLGGGVDDPLTVSEVADALAKGVILLGAQPNTAAEAAAGNPYPSDYNGVIAVNAIDSSGALQKDGSTPDVQPGTTVVAAGVGLSDAVQAHYIDSGSSYATPLVAGMLADVWQKYPKATANQLIQSLIHNANSAGGADGFGYGAASLTDMLKVNPATYPNTNPLMNKQTGEPTAQQVAAAGQPLAKPGSGGKSSVAAHAPSASASSGMATGLIVGAVIVGLLVLAGIAVLIVLVTRRTRLSRGGNIT